MAYSNIPDTEIEPGKPGSSGLFTKMRDNPEAIAAGIDPAPKILNAAFAENSINADKLADLSIKNAKVADSSLDFSGKMLKHNEATVNWPLLSGTPFIVPAGIWTIFNNGSSNDTARVQILYTGLWIDTDNTIDYNHGSVIIGDGINVALYPDAVNFTIVARKLF